MAVQFRQDFALPIAPALTGSAFMAVGVGAMLVGTRSAFALAAAIATAWLAETLDLTVIRGFPWSVVMATRANWIELIGFVAALTCAVAGLVPSRSSMRAGADDVRSRLALADEWDD